MRPNPVGDAASVLTAGQRPDVPCSGTPPERTALDHTTAAPIPRTPSCDLRDGVALESTLRDGLRRPCAVLGVRRTCDVAVDGQSIPPIGPRRSRRSRMPSG